MPARARRRERPPRTGGTSEMGEGGAGEIRDERERLLGRLRDLLERLRQPVVLDRGLGGRRRRGARGRAGGATGSGSGAYLAIRSRSAVGAASSAGARARPRHRHRTPRRPRSPSASCAARPPSSRRRSSRDCCSGAPSSDLRRNEISFFQIGVGFSSLIVRSRQPSGRREARRRAPLRSRRARAGPGAARCGSSRPSAVSA